MINYQLVKKIKMLAILMSSELYLFTNIYSKSLDEAAPHLIATAVTDIIILDIRKNSLNKFKF